MKPGHIILLIFLIFCASVTVSYFFGYHAATIEHPPTVIVDTSLIINPEIDAMLVAMQLKKAENLRLIKQRDSLQIILNKIKKHEAKVIDFGADTNTITWGWARYQSEE